jgi:uroporphyrinogen-III synthase
VTRDEGRRGALSRRLAALGARVLSLPTVAIDTPRDLRPLDAALARIDRFDWLVFTSANGVAAATSRAAWPRAWPVTQPPKVAAVGRATARALREAGVVAQLVPAQASALALARRIVARARGHLRGTRVLWPRSEVALRGLADALRASGARLVAPIAYRTRPLRDNARELARRIETGGIDAVTFLSPSSAFALASARRPPRLRWLAASGVAVASIGPTTSAALRRLGAPPNLQPRQASAAALAEAVVAHLSRRRPAR